MRFFFGNIRNAGADVTRYRCDPAGAVPEALQRRRVSPEGVAQRQAGHDIANVSLTQDADRLRHRADFLPQPEEWRVDRFQYGG